MPRGDDCVANAVLLLCEAALYFGVMVGLFRMRRRIGIGVFMCALGVMHFLETYLAGVFYVATPVGMLSPGSTVLFSGKLVMLLLLYIKEDAASVRQPIYGLLLGNALTVGLVLLLRFHDVAALPERAGAGHRLHRRHGLADGLGHGAALSRRDPHHPALRAARPQLRTRRCFRASRWRWRAS